MVNRKPIFDCVKLLRGKPFSQSEIRKLDAAIDEAEGVIVVTGVRPDNAKPLGVKKAEPSALRAAFYGAVRTLTGSLDRYQVDSINAILYRMAGMPIQHIAYVLATAWHEALFTPQNEWGRGRGKPYAKNGKYGQSQYGRGLVQLTWDRNYEWADKRLGLNGALLKDFDLALRPDIAADILVYGMLEAAFASNGKPLSAYGPKTDGSFNYRLARQTVNRMDKADLIAGHAKRFEAALREGGIA